MQVQVVINEQHRLLPVQEVAIAAFGGKRQDIFVPAEGLDEAGIRRLADDLVAAGGVVIVVSPIPLLLGLLAVQASRGKIRLGIFHNDRREAVESAGKIIHRLHPEGWRLLWI